MNLPDEPETRTQINIVPMVDVIFAVLIFFMVSSLYLTRSQQSLPVNLPTGTTGEESGPTQNTLTVVMQREGGLFLGTQPTTLDALPEAIQVRRVGTQTVVVVIRADTQVPHGQVVAVMDRLRSIPGVQIGIAIQPPSLEPSL
ncbi:ExbD/TolR family protein [Leptolyngbya sp. PCC 6406]|uniref:ExbD/TolR family protein n=1 Tax=Leptolyngbya sp. PCC 6406 TaxID=1173264 RepID=UPI0002ABF640|nr:biopolymer transporter ExbD [Leptolyngbya sp. PCC 6406]